MAAPLSIRIEGLNRTLAALNGAYENIKQEIDNEMQASAIQIVTVSKSIFSSNSPEAPEIRASIRQEKRRPFNYEIIAGYGNDPMAAYIEFGTGRYFPQYPGREAEWQALAKQYYVNGNGWMRPAPYLYPSVMSNLVSLRSNIQQVLKRNERL